MIKRSIGTGLVLGLLLGSGAASAHHSGAMFDRTKQVALSGTVSDWQWTNPHTWLVLTVADAKGQTSEWKIEGQSPGVFRGRGWQRTMMKPGDKVSVQLYPLRDGANGGSIVSVTTADGHVYN